LPFPDFNPVLLQLGPVAIRWYALAYVAGILLGWRWGVHLVKRTGLWRGAAPTATEHQIDDLVLWITLGIIVGGRLGYIAFYRPDLILSDPMEILRTWNGGMSFHGGLIGVTVALIGFAIANRIDLIRLADVTAPCVPIGLFFGRLANFVNGELWGRPTDLPWGISFCNARIINAYNGACPAGFAPRHPSQLYEAALEGAALFLILMWATHVARLLPRKGFVCGLFLSGYGLFRVALESVRAPDANMPVFPFGLTMGTMLSVPMLVIGLGLILLALRPAALAPPAPAPVDEPKSAA
jgi:phosphatidylglycerol:prolipoprotein diacylglycerol transferase